MGDHRVAHLDQALHRGGRLVLARRSDGRVVSLRRDASLAALPGADRGPKAAASREDIVALLTDHQVAEPPAQRGA
jgi:hypothetical protein